jgi:hypothetical protein
MTILTLSSSVMPCDTIRLILSFICYNFLGLERVNPFNPQKCYNFFGLERVNTFNPKKCYNFFGLERVNPFNPKNATICLG